MTLEQEHVTRELSRYVSIPHIETAVLSRLAHCQKYQLNPLDYQYNEWSEYNEYSFKVELHIVWVKKQPAAPV